MIPVRANRPDGTLAVHAAPASRPAAVAKVWGCGLEVGL